MKLQKKYKTTAKIYGININLKKGVDNYKRTKNYILSLQKSLEVCCLCDLKFELPYREW